MIAVTGTTHALNTAQDLSVGKQPEDAHRPPLCVLVSSSVVNQDGRSSSLTAPNGPSQQVLIGLALEVGEVGSDTVSTVQMHGTGTSLGDPIEIGAVCDALVHSRATPLALNAVKSHVGHGETAAGLMGIWQAAVGLTTSVSYPMLHLRSLNPYVASTIDRVTNGIKGGAKSMAVHSPMQVSPLGSVLRCVMKEGKRDDDDGPVFTCGASLRTTGVSSFAFQGTNAHLLISNPVAHPASLPTRQTSGRLWDCEWHWITPSSHPLIDQCALSFGHGPSVARYRAMVSSFSWEDGSQPPALAQFMDHHVKGRALFPGAGFFELADAAVNFGRAGACPSGVLSTHGVHAPARLGEMTIPAPLILRQRRGTHGYQFSAGSAYDLPVMVTITGATGRFEIQSGTAGGSGSSSGSGSTAHLLGVVVNVPTLPLRQSLRIHGSNFTDIFEDASQTTAAAAAYANVVNGINDDANGMWMHPASLDCSLQLGFYASAAVAVSKASNPNPLVPVAARIYESPHSLASPRIPMVTSVTCPRKFYSSSYKTAADGHTNEGESCHAIGLAVAAGAGPHASLHGLESRFVNATRAHTRASPAAMGGAVVHEASSSTAMCTAHTETSMSYALVWSATEFDTSIVASSPRTIVPASTLSRTSNTSRPKQGPGRGLTALTGISALQTLHMMASDGDYAKMMKARLDTHGAVTVGARLIRLLAEDQTATDSESLRAAWRVAAGEFQSIAMLSAVDSAVLSSKVVCKMSDDTGKNDAAQTVGVGGHGIATLGNVRHVPAVLGLATPSQAIVRMPQNLALSCRVFVDSLLCSAGRLPLEFMSGASRSRIRGAGGALLTGGGGGLGTLLTSWLIRAVGHSDVTILGRSGRSPQLDGASFLQDNAVIHLARCHVSASGEVTAAATHGRRDRIFTRITSVLHAGGVLADATVVNQSVGGFFAANAPKIDGMKKVHENWVTAEATDRVAAFSSIASLLGAAGQANYAAANGALDAWSAGQRAAGQPAVSVQWGAWGGKGVSGMAASDPGGVLSRMNRLGFGVLAPDQGLRALESLAHGIALGVVQPRHLPVGATVAVSPFDPSRIAKSAMASPIGNIFVELCAANVDNAMSKKSITSSDVHMVLRARRTRENVAAEVKRVVIDIAQEFVGDGVSPEETLSSAGLDSLGAVELRNALVSKLKVTLPGTLIFDYPTINSMVGYISTLVEPEETRAPTHQQSLQSAYLSPPLSDIQQRRQQRPRHPFANPEDIVRRVSDLVETLLGERPGDSQPLLDAGLDSLAAVELRNLLASETGFAMPATIIFDYPCVADLASFIGTQVPVDHRDGCEVDDQAVPWRPTHALDLTSLESCSDRTAPSSSSSAMFITSIAGWMPGATAASADASAVVNDTVTQTPMARWDLEDCVVDGAAKPRFSAFVSHTDCFDAATFDISAPELALMDAQQRLLLVSTTETLRLASFIGDKKTAFPISVYVGISSMDHQKVLERRQSQLSPFTATGGALSVAAGRIAFAHGLAGAAVAVDTACSSSLVALQAASVSSRGAAACVAGVNLLQVPETTMMFQRAGMIAADGRCKTLDASGDGYTRGEACASLVLVDAFMAASKSSGATRDISHNVQLPVCVLGAFVNQDGRSSTLTAPNGPAQQAAIRGAVAASETRLDDIFAVQMHGTGTPLGDPIEVGAISAVFSRAVPLEGDSFGVLTLAAPKSSVGHGEPAAGICSVIRAIRSLECHVAHPVLHLRTLNNHIVTIQRMRAPGLVGLRADRVASPAPERPTGRSNIGGVSVSAFAFQGTNAHAILASNNGFDGRLRTLGSCGTMAWDARRLRVRPPSHPFLSGATVVLTGSLNVSAASVSAASVRFHARVSATASQAYLWDHRVSGRALFPAAAFMELSTAAVTGAGTVSDGSDIQNSVSTLTKVVIPSPLLLGNIPDRGAAAEIVVVCKVNLLGELVVESPGGAMHVRASCVNITSQMAEEQKVPQCVAPLHVHGSDMGETSGVTAGFDKDDAFIARLAMPDDIAQGGGGENSEMAMPPGVLDSNLQLGGVRRASGLSVDIYIPSAIEGYAVPSSSVRDPASLRTDVFGSARVSRRATGRGVDPSDTMRSSHVIVSDMGVGLSDLSNLELKRLKRGQAAAPAAADIAFENLASAADAFDSSRIRRHLRREALPMYEVVQVAIAKQRGHGSTCSKLDHLLMGSTIHNVKERSSSGGARDARRLACAGVQGVQDGTVVPVGIHLAATRCMVRQAALQGIIHCAAEELREDMNTAAVTSAEYEAVAATTINLRYASNTVAAVDTFGYSVVSGAPRVSRLIESVATASTSCHATLTSDATVAVRRMMECRQVEDVEVPFSRELLIGVNHHLADCVGAAHDAPLPSVLINGGMGALGQIVGEWVVRCAGTANLTLTGRSGRCVSCAAPSTSESHAIVHMVRCDASTSDEVSALVHRESGTLMHSGFALMHAGGVLRDATLGNQNTGSISDAMAPKTCGLLSTLGLGGASTYAVRSMTLFSSVASLLGSAGQANYCAANGVLDAFARDAMCAGLSATSIQWGAWGGGSGMASENPVILARMKRIGVGVLAPEVGLRALKALMSRNTALAVVAVNAFHWERFVHRLKSSRSSFLSSSSISTERCHAFFAEFVTEVASEKKENTDAVPPQPSATFSSNFASQSTAKSVSISASAASTAAAAATIEKEIANAVRSVVGRDVDRSEPLVDAGVDSLGAVELRNALASLPFWGNSRLDSKGVGDALPATVAFDFPTIAALTTHLAMCSGLVADGSDLDAEGVNIGFAVSSSVIGEAARLEHQVVATGHFAASLPRNVAVADALGPVPCDRWRLDSEAASSAARFGGFISGRARESRLPNRTFCVHPPGRLFESVPFHSPSSSAFPVCSSVKKNADQ